MTAARLQGSTLTSKADYNVSEYRDLTYWRIGSQYTVQTNEKVSTRITLNPPTVNTLYITSVCFNGTTTSGEELEYFARVYNYNSNYVVSETEWLPANEWCNIFEISYAPNSNPSGTLEIWLRRKDGGILTPSSLDRTLVTMRARYSTRVPTPPSDYYATTTQTNLFIPLVTVTTPIETYTGSHGGDGGERGVVQDLNYYLQIPQEVAGVVSYIFYLFGQIAGLKYVTTLICLAMVLGTLRFIMR